MVKAIWAVGPEVLVCLMDWGVKLCQSRISPPKDSVGWLDFTTTVHARSGGPEPGSHPGLMDGELGSQTPVVHHPSHVLKESMDVQEPSSPPLPPSACNC